MPNWNNQLGGLWITGANWSTGSAPNASGAQAIMNASFSPGITAPINVNLGSAYWTVGNLDLSYNGVQNYVLTQGTVGMQSGGFSYVNVRGTSHFFSSSANLDILGTTDIVLHDASAQLHLQGDLSGFGNLYVYGLGSLVLYGANTHSGAKYINSGSINIDHGSGLGTGALNFINDPSLNPGADGTGSLFSSATISVSNEITTANGTQPRFGAVGGATLTLTGPISFFGNSTTDIHIFNLASSGTVELAPSSASIQPDVEIYIDAGRLKIGNANGATLVGGAASLTIASGTSLDVGGNNVTLKNVLGSGSITSSSGISVVALQVASSQTLGAIVFSGAGLIELQKTGAGTLTINTVQSPSLVTISTGTLALSGNGSLANASAGVQTLAGGTLDISGISGNTANVVKYLNLGTTVLGDKTLNFTAQGAGNAGTGAFDGGSGAGRVSFNLAGATSNFDLSPANFTNWGPDDRIEIIGNSSSNTLTGSSKADTIIAVFNPGAIIPQFSGDHLIGGLGNDTLRSGDGWDTLDGGGNNDTADFSAATGGLVAQLDSSGNANVSAPGLGNDFLLSIEGLRGGTGNDTLVGNGSNNTLEGGAGNDFLIGNGGDDTFIIDTFNDTVVGGAGIDTVISTSSYIMAANIENLTLVMGAGLIDGLGNDLGNVIMGNESRNGITGGLGNDTISGNGGDDAIDGGVGADSMEGGTGVDTYYVDNVGDIVSETEVGATLYDTVWTNLANYTLPQNVEIYIAINNAGSINGVGNDGITLMLGNEGANNLSSLGGNDIILGRDGNDTINSGFGGDPAGYEVISGGVGADSLTSGGGHDYFNYELITHAGDTITDFATQAGDDDDILDLRPMWQTFTNTGGVTTVAQAVSSGHLAYVQSGGHVQVFADANGGAHNPGEQVMLATILNQTAASVQTYTLI